MAEVNATLKDVNNHLQKVEINDLDLENHSRIDEAKDVKMMYFDTLCLRKGRLETKIPFHTRHD